MLNWIFYYQWPLTRVVSTIERLGKYPILWILNLMLTKVFVRTYFVLLSACDVKTFDIISCCIAFSSHSYFVMINHRLNPVFPGIFPLEFMEFPNLPSKPTPMRSKLELPKGIQSFPLLLVR